MSHLATPLTRYEQFVQEVLAPIAEETNKKKRFPREIWPILGQHGALGITVPQSLGGSGLTYSEHVRWMQALSTHSPAIALSYAAHSNLCVNQIARFGSPEQQQHYLPKLMTGEHVGALAITEPSVGSDAVGIQLKATIREQSIQLDGEKLWITNAPVADTFVVYATTDPDKKSKGITALIVSKDDNWQAGPPLDKLGMHASPTGRMTFTQCIIPAHRILGKVNEGVAVMMSGLDYERVILSAGPLGIMQRCLQVTIDYVKERQQFGQPIGNFQLIQSKLASMYTAYHSAKAWVTACAKACDQGTITRHQAASCLLGAAQKATEVASQAVQCLGANGYSQAYPVSQLLADAKLFEIGGGTNEMRELLIGRALVNGVDYQ